MRLTILGLGSSWMHETECHETSPIVGEYEEPPCLWIDTFRVEYLASHPGWGFHLWSDDEAMDRDGRRVGQKADAAHIGHPPK